MADNRNTNTVHYIRTYKMQTQIKCIIINLQNSRVATDNLVKIIEKAGTDILCIHEPYTIQNKLLVYQKIKGRNRAPIVVTNKQLDTLLIKQLSDEDIVVL